jgi:hypothetical protein
LVIPRETKSKAFPNAKRRNLSERLCKVQHAVTQDA